MSKATAKIQEVKELSTILSEIQVKLNAPKSQRNNFGNYNYRSCEDILNALKPHLSEYSCTVTVTDKIVIVGSRYYVKATATISKGADNLSTTAYAREPETKKGMDEAQITGATSSYARKYALNGLFAIDDQKDADTQKPVQAEAKPAQIAIDEESFDRLIALELPQIITHVKSNKYAFTESQKAKLIEMKAL